MMISRLFYSLSLLAFVCGAGVIEGRAEIEQLFGVNLSGGEFGLIGQKYGFGYKYPGKEHLTYYKSKGIKLVRFPFRWERVQPKLFSPLSLTEMKRIQGFIDEVRSQGMVVVLDMHNFYLYNNKLVGSKTVPISALTDVWQRLASYFKNESCIYGYGIMNEPHHTGGTWAQAAQEVTNGIRLIDSTHYVIISGEGWSSAEGWASYNPTLDVKDSANKLMYEAHVYFDDDSSGDYKQGYDGEKASVERSVNRIKPFVEWLKNKKAKGFIGEYGVPNNDPRWIDILDAVLSYASAQGLSGTYWSAGPMWSNYALSSDPDIHGDKPQIEVMSHYAKPKPISENWSESIDVSHPTAVRIFGKWAASKAVPGYLGENYLHDGNTQKGEKWVEFSPKIPVDGLYQVHARWTSHSNRAKNVPIKIKTNFNTIDLEADQTQGGGSWVSLGVYLFREGSKGKVQFGNSGTDGYVVVNAVRFTRVSPKMILDSSDVEGITKSGDWITSSGSPGFEGAGFLACLNPQNDFVRYTPKIPSTRMYEVWIKWTSHTNRSEKVPVDVITGTTNTLYVNQKEDGGEWVSLGSYSMPAGTSTSVVIRTHGAKGYVVADGVLFVPVD